MNAEEAQRIVYAFVDVMTEHSEWILDAGLLSHSKAEIKLAFDILLRHYDVLRRVNPALFREKGYDKIVNDLCALHLRVDDFSVIEEEDRADVERINELSRNSGLVALAEQLESEQLSEIESARAKADLDRAGALFKKYFRQSD